MKLILVLTFLAFVCLARSAPTPPSKARTIVLPTYDDDIEEDIAIGGEDDDDDDDELNSTTTTTTRATRRSTYVFPTKTRFSVSTRRPWMTSTTTSRMIVDDFEDFNQGDSLRQYFRNIKQFFKKLWEDIKKFFRNLTGGDIVKMIFQLFNRQQDN